MPGSRWRFAIAAAALGAEEAGECVEGGAGVRVGVEAEAAFCADAAPLAGEEGVAEEVWPDGEAVEAPFVALGADAGEAGLVGEEGELDRFGHGRGFRWFGRESPTNVSEWAFGVQWKVLFCEGYPACGDVCGCDIFADFCCLF